MIENQKKKRKLSRLLWGHISLGYFRKEFSVNSKNWDFTLE